MSNGMGLAAKKELLKPFISHFLGRLPTLLVAGLHASGVVYLPQAWLTNLTRVKRRRYQFPILIYLCLALFTFTDICYNVTILIKEATLELVYHA